MKFDIENYSRGPYVCLRPDQMVEAGLISDEDDHYISIASQSLFDSGQKPCVCRIDHRIDKEPLNENDYANAIRITTLLNLFDGVPTGEILKQIEEKAARS